MATLDHPKALRCACWDMQLPGKGELAGSIYICTYHMYIYICIYAICIHTRSSVLCQCCQDCSQALTPEGPEAGPNLEAGAGQKYHVASRRRRECDIQHRELLHSCFVWFWYILAVLVELHFVKS